MGTRCLTVIKDEEREIVVMYRQMDGYPDGHGQELADFLKSFKVVNGIGADQPKRIANGMGCLAAQIIKEFKYDAGGIYLYPAGTRDTGEEYIYTVYEGDKGKVRLKVQSGCMTAFGMPGTKEENMNILFDDDVNNYDAKLCNEKENELEEPPNDFINEQKQKETEEV